MRKTKCTFFIFVHYLPKTTKTMAREPFLFKILPKKAVDAMYLIIGIGIVFSIIRALYNQFIH